MYVLILSYADGRVHTVDEIDYETACKLAKSTGMNAHKFGIIKIEILPQ